MTFPGRDMRQGVFTAGTFGTATSIPTTVNVNLGFIPTRVELIDMTTITSMVTGTPPVNPTAFYLMFRTTWMEQFSSFVTPFTMMEALTPSLTTTNVIPITANGITPYNGGGASPNEVLLGTGVNGTSFAKATGSLTVTSTATFYVGQTILITSRGTGTATLAANSYQLGGMYATVQAITSATVLTIIPAGNATKWSNNAQFVDGAQTFSVFPVVNGPLYYPFASQITLISQANQCVVTTALNMSLTNGQLVRITGMKSFGMTQINNLIGQVIVAPTVTNPNQVTLNINTSAFSPFAFPTATAATTGQPAFTPATLVPIGSGPFPASGPPIVTYNEDTLQDATDSQAFQGFTVGSGILNTASATVGGIVAGDVIAWTAWRADE